jgi:hypothetical protein
LRNPHKSDFQIIFCRICLKMTQNSVQLCIKERIASGRNPGGWPEQKHADALGTSYPH